MPSEYYARTSFPSSGSLAQSSLMRAELNLIDQGLQKLPALSGNGGRVPAVNASGTAITSASPLLVLGSGGTTADLQTGGRLGVGGAPSTALHVRASTTAVRLRIESSESLATGAGVATVQFFGSNGDSGYMGVGGVENSMEVLNRMPGFLSLGTNNQVRMRISSVGNVGIGNLTPDATLHLGTGGITNTPTLAFSCAANSLSTIDFRGVGGYMSDGYIQFNTLNDTMTFGTAAAARMSIDGSGYVGIGVAGTPQGNVHIASADTATKLLIERTGSAGNVQVGFRNSSATRFIGVFGTSLRIGPSADLSSTPWAIFDTTVQFPSVGTTASAANAFLDSGNSNNLLRSTSSIRYKTDVRDLPDSKAAAVLGLRPVVYKSNAEADDKSLDWYGLIAEEVAAIDPRLCHYTEVDGELVPDGVQYDRVAVLLLNIVKQLAADVAALKNPS